MLEEAEISARCQPIEVCVTGATSLICYSLLPALISGDVFGNSTELSLRLYDSAGADFTCLDGVVMETQDLCGKLLRRIKVTHSILDVIISLT